ncbi:unnamed protein product [Ambrosiozyma monospora]|uniref:Unnamed protein product n=1 Tax=Ambrosiozyma monospora TaxID=43982 RepID=A0A9W6WCE5_AMBMO|nr:unnamed protein product [Ambrosiozyma monospora]
MQSEFGHPISGVAEPHSDALEEAVVAGNVAMLSKAHAAQSKKKRFIPSRSQKKKKVSKIIKVVTLTIENDVPSTVSSIPSNGQTKSSDGIVEAVVSGVPHDKNQILTSSQTGHPLSHDTFSSDPDPVRIITHEVRATHEVSRSTTGHANAQVINREQITADAGKVGECQPEELLRVDRTTLKSFKVRFTELLNPTGVIPRSFKAAVNGASKKEWLDAIASEYDSHATNVTWDPEPIFMDPKKDKHLLSKLLRTKWVFDIKADQRYKARLVARGDLIDTSMEETYSPTLRPELARALLAMAAAKGWYFAQYDFKTAYLYGVLPNELYIYHPEGYGNVECPPGKKVIYRLKKGLYGYPGAGRIWWETIKSYLTSIGLIANDAFPSTYELIENGEVVLSMGIFVDDCACIAKHPKYLKFLEEKLRENFVLKQITADEDGIQRLLGMDLVISRNSDGKVHDIKVSQASYIRKFVGDLGVDVDGKKVKTPLTPGFYFDMSQNPLEATEKSLEVHVKRFRKIVGALLYVALMTRPDIAYAVNYIARYCTYPHPVVYDQLIRIVQFVFQTQDVVICYNGVGPNDRLVCYSDSDYAQDVESRKSMNGFVIMYASGPINWKSKYTPLVCQSSTEAELQAIVLLTNELTWYQEFMTVNQAVTTKPLLRVDNQSAIDTIVYGNFSPKSKHYAVRNEVVKERFRTGEFDIEHVGTSEQLADVLTKPVTTVIHDTIRQLIFPSNA